MASSLLSTTIRKLSTSVVRKDAAKQYENLQVLPILKKEIDHAVNHAPQAIKKWRIICWYISLPLVIGLSVKLFLHEMNHEQHRPEFKKYEYLHIRRNKFPWGDGNKPLFYNPKTNALPEGYEDEM